MRHSRLTSPARRSPARSTGTWTQSSTVVGPRTPFAKDTLLFDYSYDSGEEWEEPEEGAEDLESLAGGSPRKGSGSGLKDEGAGGRNIWDTDSEDGDFGSGSDDDDSEAEGFVVSDDEADEAGGAGPSAVGASPEKAKAAGGGEVDAGADGDADDEFQVVSVKKRKRARKDKERQGGGGGKRKKELNVLVPVVKGPFFEPEIGTCGWDGFDAYRVQLLNGASARLSPSEDAN